MKSVPRYLALLLAVSSFTLLTAQAPTSAQAPAKVSELDAAGITSWQPGQGKNDSVLARLTEPVSLEVSKAGKPDGLAGTLQYDSGAITALPTIFGQVYGNRFDVDLGGAPLPPTVSLNSFSFLFAEDDLTDTAMFFQISSASSTPAIVLNPRTSVSVAGLVNAGASFSNTVFNIVPQSALGTTGAFVRSFFLGAWCLNVNSTLPVDNEALGLDTATFAGSFQGFTAESFGANPTVQMSPRSFNAILRANVTGIIPVELMAFEVD